MQDLSWVAKLLIYSGLGIAGLGALLLLLSRIPGFRVGRLPGDIYIQNDGFTFYFPVVTMLLISGVLTLLLYLFNLLRK
jgi:hypothetical protein